MKYGHGGIRSFRAPLNNAHSGDCGAGATIAARTKQIHYFIDHDYFIDKELCIDAAEENLKH